jgi:hypothetical protein
MRLCLGLLAALILSARSLDAQVINPNPGSFPEYSTLLRAAYTTLVPGPYRERVEQFRTLFLNPGTHPEADGGSSGDDGSGDGTGDSGPGSGDTGSTDDSGVSVSTSGISSTDKSVGPSDATDQSADSGTAATDPGNTGDPDPDPSVTDNGVGPDAVAPLSLTAFTAIDFAAQQAYDAVVNPFGGDFPAGFSSAEGSNDEVIPGAPPGAPPAEPGSPGSPGEPAPGVPGAPGGPITLPGGTGPLPPIAPGQDVAINAVIVSGAESPWDAVAKVPGVRNVTVTGGVIALGGGPAWLKGTGSFFQVFPDRRLLNGSVIPPVVPNVIDIRIMNCPVEVVEDTANSP